VGPWLYLSKQLDTYSGLELPGASVCWHSVRLDQDRFLRVGSGWLGIVVAALGVRSPTALEQSLFAASGWILKQGHFFTGIIYVFVHHCIVVPQKYLYFAKLHFKGKKFESESTTG
jgi:hypothetical protein